MKKGFVSIIIPTYNRGGFLKQAIDSALVQTYRDIEIIVIDDGSTDNTSELVSSYGDRIQYIKQNRKGVSAARNLGIKNAIGEFISFLDDDDLYLPHKIETNIEYFNKYPDVALLCSGFRFIDEIGNKVMRGDVFSEKSELTLHDIAIFTLVHTSSVIIRSDILQKTSGFREGARISEDYDLWSRILMLGKGYAIPEVLTCFRQHAGNTKLLSWKLLKENTRIIEGIIKSGDNSLMPVEIYICNLHRIICQNLLYKKRYVEFFIFNMIFAMKNPAFSFSSFRKRLFS